MNIIKLQFQSGEEKQWDEFSFINFLRDLQHILIKKGFKSEIENLEQLETDMLKDILNQKYKMEGKLHFSFNNEEEQVSVYMNHPYLEVEVISKDETPDIVELITQNMNYKQ